METASIAAPAAQCVFPRAPAEAKCAVPSPKQLWLERMLVESLFKPKPFVRTSSRAAQ